MMMLHWEENEPRWGLLATRQPPDQPPTMPWGAAINPPQPILGIRMG